MIKCNECAVNAATIRFKELNSGLDGDYCVTCVQKVEKMIRKLKDERFDQLPGVILLDADWYDHRSYSVVS